MAVRKVKLSDTQARVIIGSVLIGESYTAYNVGRSSVATFKRLYELGLITAPNAGALLTLEGVNVRVSGQTDILQRAFFVSDVVSREAFVIQPVKEESTDNSGDFEFAITNITISGEEHYHRTGCGDIQWSIIRNGIWAGEPWDIKVKDYRELITAVWSDVCSDYGPVGSEEWFSELKDMRHHGTFHACMPSMPEGDWLNP